VTRVGHHALIAVGKNKLSPAFTEATVNLQLPASLLGGSRRLSCSVCVFGMSAVASRTERSRRCSADNEGRDDAH
jgi:hypothetical protein